MLKSFRALHRWLRMRYGNKPTKVQGGSPPYRSTQQEVPSSTNFALLIWRMIMEGATKVSGSIFKHWKTILISLCITVAVVFTISWINSCEADAVRAEAQKKTKRDTTFVVSERYWACIHKVVDCGFHPKDDPLDPNKVVQCKPAFTTTGAGFDEPHCPESDTVQTSFVLKAVGRASEKLLVSNDVYAKHNTGSKVIRMCNAFECDSQLKAWSPQFEETRSSAAPAASSTPTPQPSAAATPTLDPRGVNRFSLLPTKH